VPEQAWRQGQNNSGTSPETGSRTGSETGSRTGWEIGFKNKLDKLRTVSRNKAKLVVQR